MICKYFLTIDSVKDEISDQDLKNWDEVEYSLKRSNYAGVVRSFSSSFEFVGRSARKLRSVFMRDQLYAEAFIEVMGICNDWTYTPLFACPLDFASYEEVNGIVKINAKDSSLAAIIKSKKGNKYEYLMSEFSDSEHLPLLYNGIVLDNFVSYKLGGDADSQNIVTFETLEGNPGTWIYQKFPINNVKEDIVENKELEWTNQPQETFQFKTREEMKDSGIIASEHGFPYGSFTNGDYKILRKFASKTALDNYVDIRVKADFEIELSDNMDVGSLEFWICTATPTGDVVNYSSTLDRLVGMYQLKKTGNGKYSLKNGSFRLYDDYILVFLSRFKMTGGTTTKIRVKSSNINVTWEGHYPSTHFNYVKPQTLLDKLVTSMAGSRYKGIIENVDAGASHTDYETLGRWDSDGRLADTVLVPRDELNNNPDKIRYFRTSFDDFCKWLEAVFGYVYYIDGDVLRFCHRSKLFSEASEEKWYSNVNEVRYKVNRDAVFSSVEVGYNPSDKDAYNMLYEVNSSATYDTGILNTEKKLTLISPYYADSVGFELAYESGINTASEDKNSQDGIWFVLTKKESSEHLVVDTDVTIAPGYEIRDGMFNLCFAPVFCLKANSGYLSSFVRELKLISSNVNNLVLMVDNENLNLAMKRSFYAKSDDCGFYSSPLFGIGELSFKTDDQNVPDTFGPVVVEWDNQRYTGYISDVDAKYERECSSDYKIIVKKIESI